MLMRVGVLVGMRMDGAIGVPVFVGVDVQVFVLDLRRHDFFLLWTGVKSGLAGCGVRQSPRSKR